MGSGEMHFDFEALHRFARAVSDKRVVKIGLFGGKSARTQAGSLRSEGGHRKTKKQATATNPELGMVHELGSVSAGIPARSFLRMPLNFQAKRILRDAATGAAELLARGKPEMVLRRLGKACENAIQRAFATGGFGFWPKLSPGTVSRKHSSKQLIDTAQLRRAVTSKVDSPS